MEEEPQLADQLNEVIKDEPLGKKSDGHNYKKPKIIMGNSFNTILTKYRKISFSEKDKGERFEGLMKAYLLTDRKYADNFKKVWLWNEFPGKKDLGGTDTGIDLVGLTNEGDY